MRNYPNFYETLKEAHARLLRTIVLYDGLPYYILAITNHKDDIFRTYLEPIGLMEPDADRAFNQVLMNYQPDYPGLGEMLDKVLEKHPDSGVLRKHINSPKFIRFRPFPLGMCNVGTQTYYIERQPTRPSMYQGLTQGSLYETLITTGSRQDNPRRASEKISNKSKEFRDCILGDHYSPEEVLRALKNTNIANDAHAIHREFALVRGPLDMLFLAYRTDVIASLPRGDFSLLKLGRDYRYCREAVEELGLFSIIQ
jgi:hypothetical protein